MAITREIEEQRASARPSAFVVEAVSAITLATHDMARSVRFYRALGFELHYGGETADFTSFCAGALPGGASYLNIILVPSEKPIGWWGRLIFHVSDVDAAHRCAVEAGLSPQFPPANAPWGERYFHLTDPDGHELSFARPLEQTPA